MYVRVWSQVIISVPVWVIPKRRRKPVKAKPSTLYVSDKTGATGEEAVGLMEAGGSPMADGGPNRPAGGFVAKAANVVARSLGAIYPQPPVDREDEEEEGEEDDDDDDDVHGRLSDSDLKNTGQILWIRGISRLQTQVRLFPPHPS